MLDRIPLMEQRTWNNIKYILGIYDPNNFLCKDSPNIWFTWSNFQKGNKHALKRLDKEMLSKKKKKNLEHEGIRLVQGIGGVTLHDHHLIVFTIS
jgi:hypothetical protein